MAWMLTDGLGNLRSQVDERWPARDKASDGTIGDAAHQAEVSGHNRDDTAGSKPEWAGDTDSVAEVRAWDMDSDLNEPGTTAQMLVDHLRALPNFATVIRYVIFNRTMYHERDGFAPTAYTGASAHTEHIHFSGAWSDAADENTTFDYRLDEVGDMALTDADIDKIVRAVWAFDPGWVDPKDHSKGVWPGVSDGTYAPGGNGTVAPGTAISTLLARQQGYGDSIRVAVGKPATVDVEALAVALADRLGGAVGVTAADIRTALSDVLKQGTDASA